MKNITIAMTAALMFFLCVCFFSGCFMSNKEDERSEFFKENFLYPESELKSPTDNYALYMIKKADSNADEYYIAVKDSEDVCVYISDDSYRTRDTLLITWDDEREDVFWIYSGDIGTYLVKKEPDGWNKYKRTDETFPDSFEKLLPRNWN